MRRWKKNNEVKEENRERERERVSGKGKQINKQLSIVYCLLSIVYC